MDLVKEAGLEQPGPDFTKGVIGKLQPKTATTTYRPLIGKTAWTAIALIALAVLLIVLFVPVGALSWEGKRFEGFSCEAARGWKPQLSKTSLYALGCLALFLVQIPFLKRLIEQKA